MPSVVAITTKSVQEVQDYYSMFGSQYAPSQEQEVEGSGSGIIIGKTDSELLIATNYHVVDGADTLSVAFADGNAYEATVKGFDESEDLAVVSVATKDVSDDTMDAISVAKIGSSDDLKIGEQVVAIGNALGYGQSVTTGIVSAKDRTNSTNTTPLIQTDAAINPGNSGGALVNIEGQVIGINSSKISSTSAVAGSAVEGMGFAIPSNDVVEIINQLEKDGKVTRPALGISIADLNSLSSSATSKLDLPDEVKSGVVVGSVQKGIPADGKLQEYDVITEIDGKKISSKTDIQTNLYSHSIGDTIKVTFYRGKDKKTVDLKLTKSTEDISD